ncbi:PTS system mannose/fructose/N-acetylgalactosamine-transporter subunit IIB [candidate division KSB1 bacterium]
MSLVLIRIDDRLIHGQVTVGWGSYLNPDRILLVSDEIAKNEWEKELYESCVPFDIAVSILPVKEAANALVNNSFANERVILLVESPDIISALMKEGAEFQQINIGGLHYQEHKKKILPYVYLSEQDIKEFSYIKAHNVDLICQDLPQAKKENLANLIQDL